MNVRRWSTATALLATLSVGLSQEPIPVPSWEVQPFGAQYLHQYVVLEDVGYSSEHFLAISERGNVQKLPWVRADSQRFYVNEAEKWFQPRIGNDCHPAGGHSAPKLLCAYGGLEVYAPNDLKEGAAEAFRYGRTQGAQDAVRNNFFIGIRVEGYVFLNPRNGQYALLLTKLEIPGVATYQVDVNELMARPVPGGRLLGSFFGR